MLTSRQLDLVLSQLKDDPGNAELLGLKEEMTELIKMLNDNLAAIQPKATSKQPSPPPPPPQQTEKWSRDKPQRPADDAEQNNEEAVSYQVNDTVLAKWLSGDRGFYPARITSITGSSTAPIYVVKFKSYDDTETLSARDIRPVSNKRKADAPPPPFSAPAAPLPGVVSSAGATVYPEAKKAAPLDDPDKPPKPKKIKAKKELEAGKNKWQEFNSKSKFGKNNKKDSMFRTPEGIHGRGK